MCLFHWTSKTQKCFSFRRASPPWTPWPGACPCTPLGALPPDPRYRLALLRSPSGGGPCPQINGLEPPLPTNPEVQKKSGRKITILSTPTHNLLCRKSSVEYQLQLRAPPLNSFSSRRRRISQTRIGQAPTYITYSIRKRHWPSADVGYCAAVRLLFDLFS